MRTSPGPASTLALLLAALLTPLLAQQEGPRTRPETSGHGATSTLADVQHFLDACVKLPHGDRLAVAVAGKSHEGRPLLLVKAALGDEPATPRLRALIIGNIHAGEVEGKEALQLLLREIANGEHEDLLGAFDLWLLPIYNVDGNEQMKDGNRRGQNGPSIVGQRPNGQGLDLNRDFIKAEAPETRALLALFDSIDPHLFMDLHTTNGSYHGYHLTYSPCLSPNMDRDLARLSRAALDEVTAAMKREHGFEVFDYGNFETRDWDGGRAPESPDNVRGWYTYDSRPRYGTNYFGLRNRISILSEAYSYCDFETRIAVTRAFVLTTLQTLRRRQQEVREACSGADARPLATDARLWFGHDATFAEPEQLDVLVGEVDRLEMPDSGDVRLQRKGDGTPERMQVLRSFRARQHRALPAAWAVQQPSPDALALLQRHGIEFEAIDAPRRVQAERFVVTKKRKPKRPFQGHQELVLEGEWQPAAAIELPLGTLLVSSQQRLAMLAAQLLEPLSDDGMSNWNFFEHQTDDTYPVLRLAAPR
ncbi:MAG: M14 family metallopeptidase [Planctomycetes bacterium]|nr:M14 family metallopeptidase [Planctomycetota bacterium]